MEKKFLYFGSTADDTGSDEEIIMVPDENVSHWEVAGTAALDVFFKSSVGQETTTGDADVHVDHSKVRLVVTAGAGNMKSVLQSIAGAVNATHSDGLIVIADDENSVYCNPLITSINAITIIDAS